MKIFLFLAIIFGFFLGVCNSVSAAQLIVTPSSSEVVDEHHFVVDLLLNTENESINAIEGKLIFPPNLHLENIETANSLINLWIEFPASESAGQIIFSGITPGGYVGEKGLVLSLLFLGNRKGQGSIEIEEAKTLRNDGEGSEALLTLSHLSFPIPVQKISRTKIKDFNAPEIFFPEIGRHNSLFDGKWFLVFTTQDKGSGIDHYEVFEGRQWKRARSPHLLQDQTLQSNIRVKAVDKAGNERIVENSF